MGQAKVNYEVFELFRLGAAELIAGRCANVVPIKNQIVQRMTVPLVQGTLRYAYKMAYLSGGDKEKAEGGIFAAAVLPQVHACSATHATTIYTNMNYNSAVTPSSATFLAVKAAFEACYGAMGITCADVGGLWNTGASPAAYYLDAGPCSTSPPPAPPPRITSPSPPGVATTYEYSVTIEVFVSDTPASVSANEATIKTNLANSLSGVAESAITITVASHARLRRLSGSRILFTIAATDQLNAASIEGSANTALSSASVASTVLGLTVTADPVIAVFSETVRTTPGSSKDKMPGWAIPVIIVCALLCALCAGFSGIMMMREKQGKPIFTNLEEPQKSTVSATSAAS